VIAVDTSAIMAIALREQTAEACLAAIRGADEVIVSAGTVAEALVVAAGRQVFDQLFSLLDTLGLRVVDLNSASARRVGEAYRRWGKGLHPAGLNFGDCFAYEVAKQHSCALLFVGGDFSKTDIASVL
jgi:ribonuclease VapC